MANTKCEFDLRERVTVPDSDGVKGVITVRVESVEQQPMYSLAWTGGNGRSQGGSFSESELLQFNPKVWKAVEIRTALPKRKPARKSKSKSKKRR